MEPSEDKTTARRPFVSLRTADDVFPVVASLAPKESDQEKRGQEIRLLFG